MRVLHTSPPMCPAYGGPFQSVRYLAQAQQRGGCDVSVRMPWGSEAERHLRDWQPATATSSGKILCSPLGWSPAYGQTVLEQDAEILHTHGLWLHPSWLALKWKRQLGRYHVASVRGMLEPWAWKHKAWKKRPVWWLWERRNLESASLLHATSEQEVESLRARGLHVPVALIPNGVNLPEEHLIDLQEEDGDREGVRTALFLSRIHPVKGLPLLLAAWGKLRPFGWRLKIVGPDEAGHRLELEKQVAMLDLEGVVTFTGALGGEAKERAYREADLFVLPTYSENFGIAVAEAMAHGLPVITTHGAPWKLLEEESCGWWVPVSVEGIASALEDAFKRSPEELSEMGRRGRKLVAERFAWDKIALDFISCYEWVLGRGEKPSCVIS